MVWSLLTLDLMLNQNPLFCTGPLRSPLRSFFLANSILFLFFTRKEDQGPDQNREAMTIAGDLTEDLNTNTRVADMTSTGTSFEL